MHKTPRLFLVVPILRENPLIHKLSQSLSSPPTHAFPELPRHFHLVQKDNCGI